MPHGARTAPGRPLARLRLDLTVWYAATFGVILALLGGGLFVSIRYQLSRQLDVSLRAATVELERAARIREMEATSARGSVVDAVEELHIPDRTLYLFDATGAPVRPDTADAWIRAAAVTAARDSIADVEHPIRRADRTLRLHAERFTLASGAPMVAVAAADIIELEDRYASLIAAFGGAAAFAVLLIGGGGWVLVRRFTAPVEESMERMRTFMADAAHELRTPVTVVRSRAEIALQQPRSSGDYEDALRGIEGESKRLGRIVDDLLTLARADAGERPLVRQRVFLDDIALDAAGAARAVAAAKRVTLHVEEFEEAAVDGDPGLLYQLVMILLDNAVKFTDPGGEVRLRVGSPAGRPTLDVRDTGRGITGDQLPHIFDRFWRGDAAHAREGGNGAGQNGAGLGLSIARWIADAHGAEVRVESTAGQGARFVIAFPGATTPAARS